MNNFMSLDALGTLTGMVLFVTLVTQLLKQYIKLDPKLLALIVAAVAVVFVQLVIPSLITYESVFLAVANIIIVTGSAIGLYEGTKKGDPS